MQLSSLNQSFTLSPAVQRALGSFWTWWTRELKDMLPDGLRRALLPSERQVILEIDGTELAVSQMEADATRQLGRYPLQLADQVTIDPAAYEGNGSGDTIPDLVLCLPQDKVLSKTLTLPLAAEENLREVLGFEMERQTPFTAEQVYYDYRIIKRKRREGLVLLNLVVTPRQAMDELVALFSNSDLARLRVTVRDRETGKILPLNLLPAHTKRRQQMGPRVLNIGLAILTVLLLVTAVSFPLLNKLRTISTLEAAADVASKKAEVAHKLREKVTQLNAQSRFLVEKKESAPLVLEVMDELTRILPDDTWLTSLEINRGKVQIDGQSAGAAALIPLLESSPVLQRSNFRSPVTQAPRSDEERFSLSVEVGRKNSP